MLKCIVPGITYPVTKTVATNRGSGLTFDDSQNIASWMLENADSKSWSYGALDEQATNKLESCVVERLYPYLCWVARQLTGEHRRRQLSQLMLLSQLHEMFQHTVYAHNHFGCELNVRWVLNNACRQNHPSVDIRVKQLRTLPGETIRSITTRLLLCGYSLAGKDVEPYFWGDKVAKEYSLKLFMRNLVLNHLDWLYDKFKDYVSCAGLSRDRIDDLVKPLGKRFDTEGLEPMSAAAPCFKLQNYYGQPYQSADGPALYSGQPGSSFYLPTLRYGPNCERDAGRWINAVNEQVNGLLAASSDHDILTPLFILAYLENYIHHFDWLGKSSHEPINCVSAVGICLMRPSIVANPSLASFGIKGEVDGRNLGTTYTLANPDNKRVFNCDYANNMLYVFDVLKGDEVRNVLVSLVKARLQRLLWVVAPTKTSTASPTAAPQTGSDNGAEKEAEEKKEAKKQVEEQGYTLHGDPAPKPQPDTATKPAEAPGCRPDLRKYYHVVTADLLTSAEDVVFDDDDLLSYVGQTSLIVKRERSLALAMINQVKNVESPFAWNGSRTKKVSFIVRKMIFPNNATYMCVRLDYEAYTNQHVDNWRREFFVNLGSRSHLADRQIRQEVAVLIYRHAVSAMAQSSASFARKLSFVPIEGDGIPGNPGSDEAIANGKRYFDSLLKNG